MKVFNPQGIAIIFLLLLTPLSAFAADTSSCEDTPSCICSPVADLDVLELEPITSVSFDLSDAADAEACKDKCFSVKLSQYSSINAYELQCTINENLTTIGQGSVSGIQELQDVVYQDPLLSVPIPGLEFTDGYESGGVFVTNYLGEYVEAVYRWSITAASILAMVMVMIGGMQYALARGNPGGIERAKKRIADAITGLVLLLSAWTIAYIIDPGTVQFSSLRVQAIEKIEFISNETDFGFVEQDWEIVGKPGNFGTGHRNTWMFDQTAYPNTAYGSEECRTETSGNIKSSGCGVTSFAMAVSSISSKFVSPDVVAESFWEQTEAEGKNFRPRCPPTTGCGCNGTHYDAFIESEILGQAGMRGRHIGTDKRQEIIELAQDGKMIIYLYRTSSGGGHYVLITGMDEDGNFLINNPWGGVMEKRTVEQVFSVAKAFTYVDTVRNFVESER